MSLFDNMVGESDVVRPDLTGPEAVAGILLAACACDGRPAREELRGLSVVARRMRLYEDVSTRKWRAIVDRMTKLIDKLGPLATVDQCVKTVPDGLTECVFANACDIVLADGYFEPEEKEFLDHLHKALRLDSDAAINIVEVIIIKNKG
jgi:tellurite resistance protein